MFTKENNNIFTKKESPSLNRGKAELDPDFARGIGISPRSTGWNQNEKFLVFMLNKMKTGNSLHGQTGIRTHVTAEELKNLVNQWNKNNPKNTVTLPQLGSTLKIDLQKTVLDACATSSNRSLKQLGSKFYIDGLGDRVSHTVHIAKDPLGDQKFQRWMQKEVSSKDSQIGKEIRDRIGTDGKLSTSDINWLVRKYHTATGACNLSVDFYKESSKQTVAVIDAFRSLDPLKHKGFTDWITKKANGGDKAVQEFLNDGKIRVVEIDKLVSRYRAETGDATVIMAYGNHQDKSGKVIQFSVRKVLPGVKSAIFDATVKPELINLALYYRKELPFEKLSKEDQRIATLINNEYQGRAIPTGKDVATVRSVVAEIVPVLKPDSPLVQLRINHFNLDIQDATKRLNTSEAGSAEWKAAKTELDALVNSKPKLPKGAVQYRSERSSMIAEATDAGWEKVGAARNEVTVLSNDYVDQFVRPEDKALFKEYLKVADKYLKDAASAQNGLVSPEQIAIARKIINIQINDNGKWKMEPALGGYAQRNRYKDPMSSYEEIIKEAKDALGFDTHIQNVATQGYVIVGQTLGVVAAAKSGQWWAIPVIIEAPHLMAAGTRAYIYDKPFNEAMKEEWDRSKIFGSPGAVVAEALGADAKNWKMQGTIILMDFFAGSATQMAISGVTKAWTKPGFTTFSEPEKAKLNSISQKIFKRKLTDEEIKSLEVRVSENHLPIVQALDTQVQKIRSSINSFSDKLFSGGTKATVQVSTKAPKDAVWLSTSKLREKYIALRQSEGASFVEASQEAKKVSAFTDLRDPKNPKVYLPTDQPDKLQHLIIHENIHVKLGQKGIFGATAEDAAQLGEFVAKNGKKSSAPGDAEIITLHRERQYPEKRVNGKIAAGGSQDFISQGNEVPKNNFSQPYDPLQTKVSLEGSGGVTLTFGLVGDYLAMIATHHSGKSSTIAQLKKGQWIEIKPEDLQNSFPNLDLQKISRNHLLVKYTNDGKVIFRDTESTNGSRIYGVNDLVNPGPSPAPSGRILGSLENPRPFDPNNRPAKGEWVSVTDSPTNTQPPSGSIPSQIPAPEIPTAGQVFHQTQLPLKNTTTMVFNGMPPQQFNGLQEVLVSAELNGLQKFELGIHVKQAENACVVRWVGPDRKIVSQSFPLNKPIQLGTNKELTIIPFQDGSFDVQFKSSAPGAKVLVNDTIGSASNLFKSQTSLGSKFKEGYRSFLRTVPGLESVADFLSDVADFGGFGD